MALPSSEGLFDRHRLPAALVRPWLYRLFVDVANG
jgi:hypothetical protein